MLKKHILPCAMLLVTAYSTSAFALSGNVTDDTSNLYRYVGRIGYYEVNAGGTITDRHDLNSTSCKLNGECYIATAVLIGNKSLLMAGHTVVEFQNYPQYTPYFIYTDAAGIEQEIKIERSSMAIYADPPFYGIGAAPILYRAYYDLGIAKLTGSISGITLPTLNTVPLNDVDLGTKGIAIGESFLHPDDITSAYQRRFGSAYIADIDYANEDKLTKFYDENDIGQQFSWLYNPESEVNSETSSVCIGDSGGPVVVSKSNTTYLIGIMTFNSSYECDAWGNSLAVDIAPLSSWIETKARAYGDTIKTGAL